MMAIDTFIAELILFQSPHHIHAISIAGHEGSVIAILVVIGGRDEIAVFIAVRKIAEVRIFRFVIDERRTRNFFLELVKLFEKSARKIEILTKIHSIPAVAPPFIARENFERSIRRET